MKERIYTVNLSPAYDYVRTKRAKRAVKILRQFIARHAKRDVKEVKLSVALNNFIWKHSICKPPRKVKVRVIIKEEGVFAYLFDEPVEKTQKEEEKRAEEKTEEKKKEREKEEKAEDNAKS